MIYLIILIILVQILMNFSVHQILDKNFTRAFEEKVKYSQFAIQFELPLEDDIKLNAQYFKHKVEDYHSNQLGLSCELLVDALPQFSSQDCQDIEV